MEGKGWKAGFPFAFIPPFTLHLSSFFLRAFVLAAFLPTCPEFLPSCASAFLPCRRRS